MKIGAAYTRLLVSDLEASFLFYRDVMEFSVTVNDLSNGYAEFEASNMKLALFRRQEMAAIIGTTNKPSDADCQDRVTLTFTVSDLDETYHHLRHKGIKFTQEPLNNTSYSLKTAYFRDPDGNLIGLYQFLF